jgi:putative flippase GtrA
MLGQFLRFGVVGVAGFVVDSTVLMAMIAAGMGPYSGRVVSYVAAASATFALNRAWTFRDRAGAGPVAAQWSRFLLVNLVGFTANYGAYAVLIGASPLVARYPVLGVAAGSLAGMFLNFALSRRLVFQP